MALDKSALLRLTEALGSAAPCRMPKDGRYSVGDPATTDSGVLAGRREITWVTGMAG